MKKELMSPVACLKLMDESVPLVESMWPGDPATSVPKIALMEEYIWTTCLAVPAHAVHYIMSCQMSATPTSYLGVTVQRELSYRKECV